MPAGLSQRREMNYNWGAYLEAGKVDEKSLRIERNMMVIGHDGRSVGEVDCIEGGRIKLKKIDGSDHQGDLYIEMKFVSGIEGGKVRLFANAEVAIYLEEEESGRPVKL